jgi:cytochrome c oxidase assembly protein subunit 15
MSVIFHLAPGWVMAHFLLSMLLLWAALVLLHRSDPRWSHTARPARAELRWLGGGLVGTGAAVLFLGTIVTGAGPHAGDPGKVHRLALPLERVTQLHADAALFLAGLVVATLIALRLADVPPETWRRGRWLLVAVAVQVTIGYTQYFLDLPRGLVLAHIAGATALWCAAVWVQLALTSPTPSAAGVPLQEEAPAEAWVSRSSKPVAS